MRIIAGKYRGKKLHTLENNDTRPTTDKVRGAIFNALGQYFDDVHVLDLFGGSGALALESLSRGAKYATIIDNNFAAIKIIQLNVESMNLAEQSTIEQIDYMRFLTGNKNKFDYIFIDPPYNMDVFTDVLPYLSDALNKDATIIIERAMEDKELSRVEAIQQYDIMFQRRYGKTEVLFLKENK